MGLELDERQRAMLLEMGVRVWLPATPTDCRAPAAPAPAPTAVQETPRRPTSEERGRARETAASANPPRPQATSRDTAAAAVPSPADAGAPRLVHDLGWESLVARAQSCQDCALGAQRHRSTLQAHAGQADWLVIGDPPDAHEERDGHPFAGPAGTLLDHMLAALGLRRGGTGAQGVHLSNIVKCRPPPGRGAAPDELARCRAYLHQEIALVQPKVLLVLGLAARTALLADQPAWAGQPLDRQRGTVFQYAGLPMVVSYPPNVLLRNPAAKAKAWADLCLADQVVRAANQSEERRQ